MTHLDGVAAADLRELLAAVEGKRATQCVIIGLNCKEGLPQRRLAAMCGVTERTIHNWLSRLDRLVDEPAPEVVYDNDRSGRPPKLGDDERDRLEATLRRPPTEVGYDTPAWTPPLARRHIAETFDAEYGLRQVRALMRGAGPAYGTIRPEYRNVDARVHEEVEATPKNGLVDQKPTFSGPEA